MSTTSSFGRSVVLAMVLGATTGTVARAQCMYEVIELPEPDCRPLQTFLSVRDMNNYGVVVGKWERCDIEDRYAIYYYTPEDGYRAELYLPPGAVDAAAEAVNDKGHMTGNARAADGHAFAWAWIDEAYITIPIPDGFGIDIEAMAINNHDQVVGWLGIGAFGERHPFIWEKGVLTLLDDVIGSSEACIDDINDDGVMTGRILAFPTLVFIVDAEGMHIQPLLDCPDGFIAEGRPGAIGADGTAVGKSLCFDPPDDFTEYAVKWDADGVTLLAGTEPQAVAYGINRFGTIVGTSPIGWIWMHGELHYLNALTGLPSVGTPLTINDRGEILTGGHDYVLRPIDRPAADITADCRVDARDLAVILADWGLVDSVADIDGDGHVGAGDLDAVLRGWTR